MRPLEDHSETTIDSVTLVTGNKGKVAEARRYLDIPIEHVDLDLPEIQSLDSREIVEEKARRAFRELGRPVLVEDVSLIFHALGSLPGPFIKWFEKELGHEGLCRLLDGRDRSCTASVTYGYCDDRQVAFAEGEMRGMVADHPRGGNSFSWGSIFIPTGSNRTYAELSHEEQERIAMRKKALRHLRATFQR